jgi:exodeoxyribonuclease VII large subunit
MAWYQQRIREERREHGTEIFTVSQVSSIISSILDDSRLQGIWLRGEVTNFKPHASGHRYFSLSERNENSGAVIQCIMWRSDARNLAFDVRDGTDVIALGSVGHYPPQGKYQFYVREMRHAGEGEKHVMVERWKEMLAKEGHFLPEKKKQLPPFPQRVGVVTSETGAVLQDIRNVLSRRFPVELVVSPTAVQGDEAHLDIVRALERIDKMVDVIIIGRGGGSFEDLFPFNQPDVVRAISACTTPVVSAIGHETDFTLADFAADVRAPTPSAAAELVVKERSLLLETLAGFGKQMGTSLIRKLDRASHDIGVLRERLAPARMERLLAVRHQDLMVIAERLERGFSGRLARERLALEGLDALLSGRNPLAVLSRGYCLVEKRGRILRSSREIVPGDQLGIRMADGTFEATVGTIIHEKELRRTD